jgi:ATP-dependent Lhr-like helicase
VRLIEPAVTPTEQALGRANALLERYGLVTREVAQAEDLPGGYAAIHKVLKTMEDAGRVRRGYFVEGLSGSQFGFGGAIDRLRACALNDDRIAGPATPNELVALAALDPANPYGALLPWPECTAGGEGKLRRALGAWVVMDRGRLVLYAAQHGRQIFTFPERASADGLAELAMLALTGIAMPGRRGYLVISTIDSLPVSQSPWYEQLRRAGFESDHRGLVAGPSLSPSSMRGSVRV